MRFLRFLRFFRNREEKVGSAPPTLSLVAPNGSEEWIVGSEQDVTWNYNDLTGAAVLYYNKSGGEDIKIKDIDDVTAGTTKWTIPDDASSEVKVKIVCGDYSDESDNYLSIVSPPSLAITSPDGGESWISGSEHAITWLANRITALDLYYSIDNGSNWNLIDENIDATLETYNWTIPVAISTNCLAKIVEHGGSLEDQSASTFTIGIGAAIALYVDSNGGNVRVNDACGAIASSDINIATGTHVLANGSHGSNNADKMSHAPAAAIIQIANAKLGPLKETGANDVFSVIWKLKHTNANGGANTSLQCSDGTHGFYLAFNSNARVS